MQDGISSVKGLVDGTGIEIVTEQCVVCAYFYGFEVAGLERYVLPALVYSDAAVELHVSFARLFASIKRGLKKRATRNEQKHCQYPHSVLVLDS